MEHIALGSRVGRLALVRAALGAATCVFVVAGCTNEKIVYRDTPPIPATAQASGGFLGYQDQASSKTLCGNCHVGHQGEWAATLHASAWKDLQASGHASATCEGCHSVSHLGNTVTDTAVGYAKSKDVRYQDVQCENCHGPGLTHVTNPDVKANRPLATIKADSLSPNGCGECHSGTHEPFVNEWQQSLHGVQNSHTIGNANCQGCHEAQGILAAWGVTANYAEKGTTTSLGVTCVICHDPHNAENEKQLRFPIDVGDAQGNLCMKCHQRRSVPDTASASGPHSPEGPTLLGEAGWWPPGFANGGTDTIIATHGSSRNPKLCATCHVARTTITDKATGAFVFQATGHKFKATPCLDSKGIPTSSETCTEAERSFKSCLGSGCHGTEQVARSAKSVAETRIATLVAETDRLVALVPKTEFSTTDGRYTTGEGSKFNSSLGKKVGAVVHNPFLVEALLTASIAQLKKDYGLTSVGGLDLNNILQRHSK